MRLDWRWCSSRVSDATPRLPSASSCADSAARQPARSARAAADECGVAGRFYAVGGDVSDTAVQALSGHLWTPMPQGLAQYFENGAVVVIE